GEVYNGRQESARQKNGGCWGLPPLPLYSVRYIYCDTFRHLLHALLGYIGILDLSLSSLMPLFFPFPPLSHRHCCVGFVDVPFKPIYLVGLLATCITSACHGIPP
ncbi:unnamed protein product, partial [Sphacelaria rigidula]